MQALDLDRQWMFADAKTRKFLTIRDLPELTVTLIKTGLSADGESLVLRVTAPRDDKHETNSVTIPARPSDGWLETNTTLAQVQISNIETDGYLYGPHVNELFSRFLRREVCLVYKGPTPRILCGNGSPEILGRTQDTFFQNVIPVTIIPVTIASETSLAELNSRLVAKGVTPITMERFRPNIIVKGNAPWAEDSWKLIRFRAPYQTDSSATLDVDIAGRRTRCQIPNVDPETAQKHRREPWDTLMSYRRVDQGMEYRPCFSIMVAPRSEGVIEVGMELEILAMESAYDMCTPSEG